MRRSASLTYEGHLPGPRMLTESGAQAHERTTRLRLAPAAIDCTVARELRFEPTFATLLDGRISGRPAMSSTSEPSALPRDGRMSARGVLGLARRALLRDPHNLARWGAHAPLVCRQVWVQPLEIDRRSSRFTLGDSGRVLGGDWDREGTPLEATATMRRCRQHWEQRIAWEDTGVYDIMLARIRENGSAEGCQTFEDVLARYRALDQLFEQVRRDRRLQTSAELTRTRFRECHGVMVHTDRDTRAVMGLHGLHRLAIARILRLPQIPACLGVVHERSVHEWKSRLGSPRG